jgi:Ca-activated chloride channel family protein
MFALPLIGLALLVASVALIVWWIVRLNKPASTMQWSNTAAMSKVMISRTPILPIVVGTVLGIVMLSMSVVAARPLLTEERPTENATVFLIYDHSPTMGANDIAPTRMQAAQATSIAAVKNKSPQLFVAVVPFASTAKITQSPTQDSELIIAALERIKVGGGGSAIGEAINSSLAAVAGLPGYNPIAQSYCPRFILLSDGVVEDKEGQTSLDDAVTAAKSACVAIDTVLFASKDGGMINGRPIGSDPAALKAVSAKTGGNFYEATSGEALQRILEDVQASVATRTDISPISLWIVGVAIVIWVLSALGMIAYIKLQL